MTTKLEDIIEQLMLPILKPNVINFEMIEEAYWQNVPKGESGRLKKLETFQVENIEEISLEFKSILKIDHLWVMPNLTKLSLNFNKIEKIENLGMLIHLTELDLSFNNIEKIENLENLKYLQILSLFNNRISKIENLDTLENLVILSIGNNLIDTTKGIERFRFLKKLFSLNFEGNPVTVNKEFHPFRIYIAAVLPHLKYYEYTFIHDDERKTGVQKYERLLRQLEQSEEDELKLREKFTKDIEDESKLSPMFIEYLNEHQLFESFFIDDKPGETLRMIKDGINELNDEYKNDIYSITQKIYKLGLNKYEERLNEIEMYEKCVENGTKEAQISGQNAIAEFEKFKVKLFQEYISILKKLQKSTTDKNDSIEIELKINLKDLEKKFNNKLDEIWKIMMEEEIHLYESIEEITSEFSKNITQMIDNFIEQEQLYFAQLREVSVVYSESLQSAVHLYIIKKSMCEKENEVPQELKECATIKLVECMKNNHLRKIDAREDRLVERAKLWLADLLENKKKKNFERNRNKIKEINYFLNTEKKEFDKLKTKFQ